MTEKSFLPSKIRNVMFTGFLVSIFLISQSGWGAISYTSVVDFPTGSDEKEVVTELLWRGIRELPAPERPRVVLVLGGGGARGLVHIGVLRVLEEEGIPVDEIVGVSVGALIGALYAGGYSSQEIESMAHEIGWDKLTNFSKINMMKLVFRDSLFSTRKMENYLERRIGEKNFSDLNIPFSCVATDIRTGSPVVFNEGPVAIAARASATIPGLFEPVEYGQRLLVDGGIVNNLPTNVVPVDSHDVVIAVLPVANEQRFEAKSVLNVLVQSIDVQKRKVEGENSKSANVMIKPFVHDTSMIDLGKSQELIDWGIQSARKKIPELKAIFIQRSFTKYKSLSQHGRNIK